MVYSFSKHDNIWSIHFNENLHTTVSQNKGFLHAVMNMPYVITSEKFSGHKLEAREARQRELLLSLEKTLDFPAIQTVTVLYDDHKFVEYLRQNKVDERKLQLHYMPKVITTPNFFELLSERMIGKLLMVMNADSFPYGTEYEKVL